MIDRALPLVAVGITHREASVDVRAPLALTEEGVAAALARWNRRGTAGFILSTCQRTELYVRQGGNVAAAIADAFPDRRGDVARALRQAWVRPGVEAVRHLFRVNAGLESSVLGESEIVAQVRRGVRQARDGGTMDALTHHVADAALLTGKRVRCETFLAGQSRSFVGSLLREAARRLGTLGGSRALIVGTGHMARLVLQSLRHAGLREVVVTGRTPGHVAATALQYGANTGAWAQLPSLLDGADLVVCCTAAPEPVLTARTVIDECTRRSVACRRWPVLVDLGMPRAIERHDRCARHIIDLDFLAHVEAKEGGGVNREVTAAGSIVDEEVARLQAWWQSRRDFFATIDRMHAGRVAS
jgi:glutamyl-tRNA reductase